MARLTVIAGDPLGRSTDLSSGRTLIGRGRDAHLRLDPQVVSRHHAAVVCRDGTFFLEDLHSENKTYLNGQPLSPGQLVPLHEGDRIQVGPVVLQFQREGTGPAGDFQHHIRETLRADPSNRDLYSSNAAEKLRLVLDIARHLRTTLDLDPLLDRLLGHLFDLFPQAERAAAVLVEPDSVEPPGPDREPRTLRVRAQRVREGAAAPTYPYSRSLMSRALDSGEALLSENVRQDPTVPQSPSVQALELRSFLCVPLLGAASQPLGAVQLDTGRGSAAFTWSDLDLLATIAVQVSTVVENAAMHAALVRRARTDQDLQAAGEIQRALLPYHFDQLAADRGIELYARVRPARCVAGDLYDLVSEPDGRLAFLIGDVSGKGMPAALYMIAVRTLTRQLIPQAGGPADLIVRLHRALMADTGTAQFVTVLYGVYDPLAHAVTFALAGHPPPLLRRADGTIAVIAVPPVAVLGLDLVTPTPSDITVALAPGDTFIAYTDGCYEQFAADGAEQFGLDRLLEVLGGPRTALSLRQCGDEATAAVRRFAASPDQADDETLLLLRRRGPLADGG